MKPGSDQHREPVKAIPPSASRTAKNEGEHKPPAKPSLSRWFWGTIFVLLCATVLLTVLAEKRKGEVVADLASAKSPDTRGELFPSTLDTILTEANKMALREVTRTIHSVLENAYKPVYHAIPAYADFHYSLRGEYLELTEAALGNLSGKLQEKLFSGLAERLDDAALTLDAHFEETFRNQLKVNLANVQSGMPAGESLGPLTQTVIEGAKARIMVTAPVAGVAAVGGAASIKAASAVIAKKLGAKIALKVAAKGGAKLGAAAAGFGTGAAICSWAGPVAVVCAAGGATLFWASTDIAVIKLDEIFNRDEFETELRLLIDEDKAARRVLLENAIIERAAAVQAGSDKEIQDFTLRQLSGAHLAEVCSTAAALVEQYSRYQEDIRERHPSSLERFRANLSESAKDISLGRLVREIEENLAVHGARLVIDQVRVLGNVPFDLRRNRDISGRLLLDRQAVKFDRASATKDEGFDMRSSGQLNMSFGVTTRIQLSLEQHRHVRSNKFFGGAVTRDLFDAMPPKKGLQQRIMLNVPIAIDEDAKSLRMVDARPTNGHTVSIQIMLRGARLADLKYTPNCVK